jgi:subtilisin family serine protease
VIIGVFDNGFRLPDHEAFQSMSILATYDFVDGKESVVPENPSYSFGSHGISVLSVIGGYVAGTLIGPAFRATYLLARTENDSSETPVEEDYWVAAIEWADSLGVQVTNTSLGYLYYDSPYEDWTWEDMDGRTTVISQAATMAARKGIVVCNSAGNNGYHPERNTLNAPADADSILAVGAANSDGSRASFSSVGPTTDVPSRIKPDITAQGAQIIAASGANPTGYILTQGTSLSSPLAAGTAALLIQAKPDASPMEIIQALKGTASQASSPDNLYGWGILDAVNAIVHLTGTDTIVSPTVPEGFVLSQNYPNPFNPGTRLRYELPEAASVTITVFDVLGREIKKLREANQRTGTFFVDWDGTDSNGIPVSSGVYIARLRAVGVSRSTGAVDRKMMLMK